MYCSQMHATVLGQQHLTAVIALSSTLTLSQQ